MDGFEVCRLLKAQPATSAVPVIVISALDDVDEKVRAFEAGAADYVIKPFEPPEVLSRVGAHIQLYRLRRELEAKQVELERSRLEVHGQNLELRKMNEELREAERRTQGALPLPRAAQILVPVAEVLAEAHALGLVHRDIKPANVFLHRTQRGETVKLLDFGIAKLLSQAEVAGSPATRGGVIGTPWFIAPERVLGSAYDERADVYSLGVMLFMMLSLKMPFAPKEDESNLSALLRPVIEPTPELEVDGLPQSVRELAGRMLAKDPVDRPAAREVGTELVRFRPR